MRDSPQNLDTCRSDPEGQVAGVMRGVLAAEPPARPYGYPSYPAARSFSPSPGAAG